MIGRRDFVGEGRRRRERIMAWISDAAASGARAPSNKSMAQKLGISEPAVSQHLHRLVSAGRVSIARRHKFGMQITVPGVGTTAPP